MKIEELNRKTSHCRCVLCGGEVTKDEHGSLDYAGYITIDFGYGSKFDGDGYAAFIHDSCFEKIRGIVNFSSNLFDGDRKKKLVDVIENVEKFV